MIFDVNSQAVILSLHIILVKHHLSVSISLLVIQDLFVFLKTLKLSSNFDTKLTNYIKLIYIGN